MVITILPFKKDYDILNFFA